VVRTLEQHRKSNSRVQSSYCALDYPSYQTRIIRGEVPMPTHCPSCGPVPIPGRICAFTARSFIPPPPPALKLVRCNAQCDFPPVPEPSVMPTFVPPPELRLVRCIAVCDYDYSPPVSEPAFTTPPRSQLGMMEAPPAPKRNARLDRLATSAGSRRSQPMSQPRINRMLFPPEASQQQEAQQQEAQQQEAQQQEAHAGTKRYRRLGELKSDSDFDSD
jgi:hypothetical protein